VWLLFISRSFRKYIGNIDINYKTDPGQGGCAANSDGVNCYNNTGKVYAGLIAHELGHVFASKIKALGLGDPNGDMGGASITYTDDNGITQWVTGKRYDEAEGAIKWERGWAGYKGDTALSVYHGSSWDNWNSPVEEFADMFVNWVMDGENGPNGFTNGPAGNARRDWMNTTISSYLP